MSYIDQNLSSGETVLYRTRLHWMAMLGYFLSALVMGLAGVGLLMSSIAELNKKGANALELTATGLTSLMAAAVVVTIAFWKRSATEMAVTNRRVLVKAGLLTRHSTEIMLSKVESVSVDQTLLGRLLSYGTIMVRGVGGTPEPFLKVAHPLEFRRQVQEQIDRSAESRAATYSS